MALKKVCRVLCKGIDEVSEAIPVITRSSKSGSINTFIKASQSSSFPCICRASKIKHYTYNFRESEIYNEKIKPFLFFNRVIIFYDYNWANNEYLSSEKYENEINQKINGIVKISIYKKTLFDKKIIDLLGNKYLKSYSNRIFYFSFDHDSRSKNVKIGDNVLINYENGIGENGWENKEGIIMKKDWKYNRYQYVIRVEL